MSSLPALTVAVPLLGAAVLAGTEPLARRTFADVVAIGIALATTVLCAILLSRSAGHEVVHWFSGWKPHGGVALGISFAIDPIGAGLATFVGVLTVTALVFSSRHMGDVGHAFHALMLVFLAAMVGFALSGDLFNMFVFFELMTVAAIALTAYRSDERAPLEGSFNFAVTNSIGGFLVLTGIALLYGRTGALNLAQLGESLAGHGPDSLVVVAFGLLAVGFLVKAAVAPFHFWLADAYAVAPTPVCILFAGALSELGLYAIARIYWTVFSGPLGPHAADLRAVLVVAGVLTALLGAGMALAQHHLKRLLAFATMSYVGLFLVGLALLSPDGVSGSGLYVVGDGLAKASLFICVGILQMRLGHINEFALQGRCRHMVWTGAVFTLAALVVAGLPPAGAFLGKSGVEDAASKLGYGWVIPFVILVSALTGGALLRAAARVFLGWGKSRRDIEDDDEAGEPPAEETIEHTPAALWLPAAALVAAAIAFGVVPGLAHSMHGAAARFVDRPAYAAAVLHGAPLSNPPVHGTHEPQAGDWLYALVGVLGALAVAGLALFGGELRRRVPERVAATLAAIRGLHSGHPGDYVAWLTFGTAAFGGAFAVLLR
jgi:multicomponent Na+:H+ antiporter subunit D